MEKTTESPTRQPTEAPEGSAASGTASPAASSPFVADPGPPFDPDGQAPPPDGSADYGGELHALPEPPDLWEQEQVRGLLTAKGQAIHAIAGVGERDWTYTEQDLAAIAPPLTRILNRYEPTRAAAHVGDELALVIGFGGYASRSIRERRAVMAELDDAEPEPISGVAAPAGTGPDHDPDIAAAASFDGTVELDPEESEWTT